ncbi:MAG: 16S rRNA (guanine(966)-N(2))-methyltransferase RsmD [Bdellovibrionales bacterium]
MRITGGTLRGRTLKAPDGRGTRPTADRVREALFNILAHHDWGEKIGDPLDGGMVLDAFAGTGALGLEALSRGAASCIFFEKDRSALQCLKENVALTKMDEVARIMPLDATKPPKFVFSEQESSTPLPENAEAFSTLPQGEGGPCVDKPSLLFLDPPYHKGLIQRAVGALNEQGWMATSALLVCETAKGEALDLPFCKELLARDYGDTCVRFFSFDRKQENARFCG